MMSPKALKEFKELQSTVDSAAKDCLADLLTQEVIESYRFLDHKGQSLRVSIRVLQETDGDWMLAQMGAQSGTATLDHPKGSQRSIAAKGACLNA